MQEIKFEPNVMCEPVDKKFTFKASQVWGQGFY
jgi:ubiquitin carboxyl-terminal hydrolase 7